MFRRLFKSEHQRIEEMLSAYLDGELSPKEQVRVEKHLAQCADCAQNLHTLRQTVALLGQLPPVAVPRAFTIRPAQAAQRPSLFHARPAYVYLRAATALATVLLAVVLAGDAFLFDLAPYLAPAMGGEAPAAEVVREVEVEKAVEKKVLVTVEVEKEVVVEAPAEAPALESKPAYAATPSLAPTEDKVELMHAPTPLPTPSVVAKEMEAAGTPLALEKEGAPRVPPSPGEEQVEATPMPMPTPLPADAIVTAEPAFTPTAVVEVMPPTPLPHRPTVPAAVRLSDFGLMLLRIVEISLLALVLVLAIATLVAKRRQGAR